MEFVNSDFVARYRTSKRITPQFVNLMEAQVEQELPGIRFHISSTADILDNVEIECNGLEMDDAFHEQKVKIYQKILAIADRVWRQLETDEKKARTKAAGF